jgi:type IV pilus assembly protein PilY1
VVDAFTGQKLSEIITSTTNDEELSGIARIANLVTDGLRNNVTQYVYGGDLSGALWRFDISAGSAVKLGSTSATAGAQPITVQPELASIKVGATAYTVVYFGTGRYLGTTDLSTGAPSTATAQGIYAVKDTGADIGVLTTTGANLVAQTLDSSVNPRTSTSTAVDWGTQNGWYVTTPVGERFNVDPGLQLGTLVIAANIPAADYCNPTGSSILYQLSYKSGAVLKTSTFQAQTVGTTQLQLGGSGSGSGNVHGGKVVIEVVLADGTTVNTDQVSSGGAAGTARRVSWREIE